jgi:hypothetical protein
MKPEPSISASKPPMPKWARDDTCICPPDDHDLWLDWCLARFLGAVFEGYQPGEEEKFSAYPDPRPGWSYPGECPPARRIIAGRRAVK